jgi:hypothetical protein
MADRKITPSPQRFLHLNFWNSCMLGYMVKEGINVANGIKVADQLTLKIKRLLWSIRMDLI